MKLCYLDTETHAIDNPEIIQLAMLTVSGESEHMFAALYKSPSLITPGASSVHHITNEMVKDAPPFGSEDIVRVNSVLSEHVMVAHNAPFDIDVMTRAGCNEPKWVIDTLKIAHTLYDLESYKLQFIRYHLGITQEARAHDAEGDVSILREVFEKLLTEWKAKNECDDRTAIAGMVVQSRSTILYRKFPFGKYRGRVIEEIVKDDRSYCHWLLKACDENMKHTLRSLM